MNAVTVSCRTEFEACYVQDDELNAHRYRVEVTVDGPQRYQDTGRVIEFAVLNRYLKESLPDKHFIYSATHDMKATAIMSAMELYGVPVYQVSGVISVEDICIRVKDELQDLLNRHAPGVRVLEVKLRETSESFATWTRSDN